jgi:ATP adenylyltransferase
VSRLWAPWRMAYVGASEQPAAGCIFCRALEAHDDRSSLILHRGQHAFLILNAFPYAPGHLMAVLNRHVGAVVDATTEELADAMGLVQRAVRALGEEYRAQGFNIGVNQGRVAGAGIQDHLHIHVVPRWNGDTNFMPVISDVRVLPESLASTWDRLRSAING